MQTFTTWKEVFELMFGDQYGIMPKLIARTSEIMPSLTLELYLLREKNVQHYHGEVH